MKTNCSILILSCDKNKKLLEFFLEQFDINWKECKYDIYISLEEIKQVNYDKKINIINYNKNRNWSERVKYSLQKINTKNVLIILDDFIIEEKVNSIEIEKLNNLMCKDKTIANIILTNIIGKNENNNLLMSKYIGRNRYGKYKTALQCGIWDREVLINLLKDKESPWEFEIFGNIRSFLIDKKFYALNNDDKPIKYNDGFFIVQGKVNSKEKVRLENLLNKKINLPEYDETGENLIRDNISLEKRIMRRLKIIIYYLIYKIENFLIRRFK